MALKDDKKSETVKEVNTRTQTLLRRDEQDNKKNKEKSK